MKNTPKWEIILTKIHQIYQLILSLSFPGCLCIFVSTKIKIYLAFHLAIEPCQSVLFMVRCFHLYIVYVLKTFQWSCRKYIRQIKSNILYVYVYFCFSVSFLFGIKQWDYFFKCTLTWCTFFLNSIHDEITNSKFQCVILYHGVGRDYLVL